ncbi:LysE family translocator [Dyella flava]|nr:LysE family translocator [Dyella flava]
MIQLLPYFLITVLVINLAPGPAMMFVMQQSQRRGVQRGLVAALGIEFGVFIYVLLTAFGVTALFRQYPPLYTGLQVFGAAYLLYLAYSCWPRPRSVATDRLEQSTHRGTFAKGVLINLTNPKIALFFLSLIPQFVPQGSDARTFVIYGLIFNIGGLLVNGAVALLADRVSRVLKGAAWFEYIPPLLFTAIAIFSIWNRLR